MNQPLRSDHYVIANAAVRVLLLTSLAKLAVAAREVTLAWRFGRGFEVDAYNLALAFSTWLPLALVSVMTIVIVPIVVKLDVEGDANQARFLRELTGLALVLGTLICIATWIAAPWVIPLVGKGLSARTTDLALLMLQTFAPVALMTVLAGVYAARLQAANDHRYALAEGLPPLAVVISLLAWHTGGASPLLVGTVVGLALQVYWLGRLCGNRGGPTVQFEVSLDAPQWRMLWRGALVMGAGQLAMSLTQPIDQWFAASVGPGAIATLGYANRIVSLVMALGATVIARATLPIFSAHVVRGDSERVRRNALAWSSLMLIVGAVAAAGLWTLAPWLTAILFQRGAFSAMDTSAVAEALRWAVWQLPPYLAGLVLVSQLASTGRYRLIGMIAMLNSLFKVLACYILVDLLGVNGILLSTVLMYLLATTLCLSSVLGAPKRVERSPT